MSITVTWYGHATLGLDIDGTKVLVDPFFGDNPVTKVSPDDVAADYILITHGHFDHVADALAIAKRTGATVISNFEICGWFNANGHEKTHPQHLGGSFAHPFGRVKLTVAFHGSMLPDGSNGGNPCGFLLTIGEKRVYIAGDTAVYSDMSLIGRHGLDLAILPIGDNFTMGPEDALLAVKFLEPRVVLPVHYDTWPLIAQDVEAWAQQVEEKTDARVVVVPPGGSHTV